jgi:hypothetical protein
MSMPPQGQVVAWRQGDEGAAECLIPLVYDGLRSWSDSALRCRRSA